MDSETELERHERGWAVFPLARLRPEQVIGSMLQAGSVQTIDRHSNLFVRAVRFFREQDFVRDYGDPGEDELEPRAATVSQALLRMNGQLTGELAEANPFTAVGRIAHAADTDADCLDVLLLVCLTRHPTAAERAALLPSLHDTKGQPEARRQAVEDIVWALFNSEEFSWNH
jgi:hypothetical protein